MEVIYRLKKKLFSYDVLEMDNKRIKKKLEGNNLCCEEGENSNLKYVADGFEGKVGDGSRVDFPQIST